MEGQPTVVQNHSSLPNVMSTVRLESYASYSPRSDSVALLLKRQLTVSEVTARARAKNRGARNGCQIGRVSNSFHGVVARFQSSSNARIELDASLFAQA